MAASVGAFVRHGTDAAYKVHGCRCEKCRQAHAAAQLEYLRKRREGDPRRAQRMLECLSEVEPTIGLLHQLAVVRPLRQALKDPRVAGDVEELHHTLWRVSGPLRRACRCYREEPA